MLRENKRPVCGLQQWFPFVASPGVHLLRHWHPERPERGKAGGINSKLETAVKITALSRHLPEIHSLLHRAIRKIVKKRKKNTISSTFPSCTRLFTSNDAHCGARPFCIAPETVRTPSLHPAERVFLFQQVRDLSGCEVHGQLAGNPSIQQPQELRGVFDIDKHQLPSAGTSPGRKAAASGVSRKMENVYLTLGAQKQGVKGCRGTKFLEDAGVPQHLCWACLSLWGSREMCCPITHSNTWKRQHETRGSSYFLVSEILLPLSSGAEMLPCN